MLNQIRKSKVDVRLNTLAAPEYIASLKPDAIIVAIGGEMIKPNIEGIDKCEHVVQAMKTECINEGTMVVIGAGAIGAEYAVEKAEENPDLKVVLVDSGDTVSARENWLYRIAQRQHMNKCDNLKVMLKTNCTRIMDKGVELETKDGRQFIKADKVVYSVGMRPKHDEAFSFYGIVPEISYVGDCHRPGHVLDAINDSYFIAANL